MTTTTYQFHYSRIHGRFSGFYLPAEPFNHFLRDRYASIALTGMPPKRSRRLLIYAIATFAFAALPIILDVLQRGDSLGSIGYDDIFPSPAWFVYTIAVWAATLAELAHEDSLGEFPFLMAICATLFVVVASYQYAALSHQLESGKALDASHRKWFTTFNIVLALVSTGFAVFVKMTEGFRDGTETKS